MQALYLTSLDYKNRVSQLQRVIFLSCFPKVLYRYQQALNISGARKSISSFFEDWNLLDGDEVEEQYVRAPGQLHRQLTHDGIPSRQNDGWTEFLFSPTTVCSWAWSFCGPFLQLQTCIPRFHQQYAFAKVAPEILNDINNALFLLNLYLDCDGVRQLFNIASIKNHFDDIACRRGQDSQQDSGKHAGFDVEVPIQEDSHHIMQAWKAVTVWNISARMLAHYWEKHLPTSSNLPKFYLIQLSILGPSAKAMTDPVVIFKSISPRLSASAFSTLSPEERIPELEKRFTSPPAEFRGRVHGEACFITLFCPPESGHLTPERSHLLRNLTQMTISQYICVPRKICYACAKLRTLMKLDLFLPDSHGRIVPWTPPPDLPLDVLRALREDFERILVDYISKNPHQKE
ncbi:hypothetical protein CPB85DRAFT_1319706 [Mucidula mucida]|nr:hypothetical protein CPB85DRAFT_1319706 [Mucidula mucida]